MELPSISGSNMPQPQRNLSLQPPGSSVPAQQEPFIQPPGTGPSPSHVAFIQGLIFGLIFASISLVVNILDLMSPLEFSLFFLFLHLVQWAIAFPISYLLAGVLASRNTGKIKTGVFASFWITLWYVLSSIVFNILQVAVSKGGFQPNDNPIFAIVVLVLLSLLVSGVLGTSLGALGGLLGAALKQQQGATSRKTIGALYLISLALEIYALFLLSVVLRAITISGTAGVIFFLLLIVMFGIPGIIGWISALVNLSRAQEWVWFFIVFCFGSIALLLYWITGPEPLKAA
jgi:hypothetical protein